MPPPADLTAGPARRAALLVLLAAGPLAAQSPASPPPVPTRPSAAAGPQPSVLAAGLRPGKRVRITVRAEHAAGSAAGRVTGRLESVAGDTLVLFTNRGYYRTPVAAVDSLWLRDRRATGRGARIGAGLGAVGLGGFAFLLTQAFCTPTSSCPFGREELATVAVGATVGAAGGALAGGIVGTALPAWRRVRP